MKANSPPGASSRLVSTLAAHGTPNRRQSGASSTVLATIMATKRCRHQQRFAPDEAEIDVHADREEEDAQQQAAERVDHRLDGAAVLGLRQQQAGDEGAERHRQAGIGRDHARADRDQQGGGHEEFRIVGAGGQPEQRLQHEAADDGDDADGDHRLGQRHDDAVDHRGALGASAERADQEQQRHHGKVLGEQDGETGAAGRRHHAALAGQQLHDDGGRGKRQADADDQRRSGRLAEPQRAETDRQRRHDDLQAAQPEHQPAHGEQAAHRQFEADEEQQEDDAEVGDEGDLPSRR